MKLSVFLRNTTILIFGLLVFVTTSSAQNVAGNWNVAGTWVGVGGATYFQQRWILSGVSGDGTFTGSATGSGALPTGRMLGQVTSGAVYIYFPDTPNGGYPSGGVYFPNFTQFYVTISGDSLSGTWSVGAGTNNSKSGLIGGARQPSKANISGRVEYTIPETTGVQGIEVKLSGSTTKGARVSLSQKTDSTGAYQFEVEKGTYSLEVSGEGEFVDSDNSVKLENGGSLSFSKGVCPGSVQDERTCNLPTITTDGAQIETKVLYTLCGMEEKLPNGKPPTHCPVVFVPGFLGSRIVCDSGARELWPGVLSGLRSYPGWSEMLLQTDGATNAVDNGQCNMTATSLPDEDGVVAYVGGVVDVYGSVLSFLRQEYSGLWAVAPYDWRKSPALGVPLLDSAIDQLLARTKAKHVVLYGHSMGGLVIRDFLKNSPNREKVARVLTAGTPYWGAPKSHFSLLGGYVDTPAGTQLDAVTYATSLQKLARNLTGLFHLNPSANLGGWLYLSRSNQVPTTVQDDDGEYRWMRQLGANPDLWRQARNWHVNYDGFPDGDFDYKAVVGVGLATTSNIIVSDDIERAPIVSVKFGNGDGTVPVESATQGASRGGPTLGRSVAVHYACNIDHVSLPGAPTVLAGAKAYLMRGEAITGLDSNCEYSGTIYKVYDSEIGAGATDLIIKPTVNSLSNQASLIARTSPSSLTLQEAIDSKFIDYMRVGKTTFLIFKDSQPAELTLSGKNIAVTSQRVSSRGDGEVAFYSVNNGTLSLDSLQQQVKLNGTALAPTKVTNKTPTTTAKVSKSGKSVKIQLSAKSPYGIKAIYYKINKGAAVQYKKALKLTGKSLKSFEVSSVDLFGKVEKWKKVKF